MGPPALDRLRGPGPASPRVRVHRNNEPGPWNEEAAGTGARGISGASSAAVVVVVVGVVDSPVLES